MLATTEAIVLHARKFGDTSKIISLYTKDEGMISVIAKGSRLPKNKFGSSLEPISHTEITFYKKQSKDLFLLSKSELIKNYRHIFDSPEKLTVALAILESVTLTQQYHEPNEMLFELLISNLSSMNEAKRNDFCFFVKFQIELARLIGFGFDFRRAGLAQNDDYIYLSINSGEFVVSAAGKDLFRLRGSEAYMLYQIDQCPIENISELEMKLNNINVLNTMLSRYFGFHLDKYFHYKSFDTN
jgi:DNA repair protein RecO (recombination protein O)